MTEDAAQAVAERDEAILAEHDEKVLAEHEEPTDAARDAEMHEDAHAVAPTAREDALTRARNDHSLTQQLEALLMVADEPQSIVGLATALDRPVAETRRAVAQLVADYNGDDGGPIRGFELREVAGGYRLYVRESLDPVVVDFVQQQTPARLSQAALETLAVIAYRQPISRGAIASVRAVNVDSVVRTLVNRGLVVEVGHDPETGATLYGTNESLLGYLGISSIEELPPIAPLLDDGSEGFDDEAL